MSLESLYINDCPKAFVPFATKHNALVRLFAALEGTAGFKIVITDRNILISPDIPALATALADSDALYNMAYEASIDAAAAGQFNSYVNIPAAQVTDFDAAALAAVLPITSADVSDFDAAAVAAVLPITSSDVTDFDAAAVAAVLPITSSDVSDFDAAAVAAVLPIASTDVSDFDAAAAAAAPVQSVAGRTGAIVLTSTDLSDFDDAAVAAVLPISWADITDAEVRANSAAANYVANYTNENVYTVCIANTQANVTFIVKA